MADKAQKSLFYPSYFTNPNILGAYSFEAKWDIKSLF